LRDILTMPDVLRIKRRAAGGAAGPPAALANAEVCYNEQDDTLYYGKGGTPAAAASILPVAGPGTFAAKASPALTGTPTAPTAAPTVNNTQIATTAYVTAAIAPLLARLAALEGHSQWD
jgi:hypothetical protein